MSQGDLIAEVLAHGLPVAEHMADERDENAADDFAAMFGGGKPLEGQMKDSAEIVRIANRVLEARFGFTINFAY